MKIDPRLYVIAKRYADVRASYASKINGMPNALPWELLTADKQMAIYARHGL